MRRTICLLAAGLLFAGVATACDDANKHGRYDCTKPSGIDTDDCRFGPGDGVDEPGPMR